MHGFNQYLRQRLTLLRRNDHLEISSAVVGIDRRQRLLFRLQQNTHTLLK